MHIDIVGKTCDKAGVDLLKAAEDLKAAELGWMILECPPQGCERKRAAEAEGREF